MLVGLKNNNNNKAAYANREVLIIIIWHRFRIDVIPCKLSGTIDLLLRRLEMSEIVFAPYLISCGTRRRGYYRNSGLVLNRSEDCHHTFTAKHLFVLKLPLVSLQRSTTASFSDNTQGKMTSQNLWSRYDRHFVGITWHNVWNWWPKICHTIQTKFNQLV